MQEREIDAVICWVDGNDPALREKRMQYVSPEQASRSDIAGDTRYASEGEIGWCVCSLLRNAPFIRHIWIITDDQVPPIDGIVKRNFPDNTIPISIVDHKDIFRGYEDALPTFNSSALETMMWRIPGLADWFLYLNDDMMVTAPVTIDDVFTRDGRPIVNGYWHSTLSARIAKFMKRDGHLHFRDFMLNSAEILGVRRFVRVPHVPRLYHRSAVESFYEVHPDLMQRNMRYRFRCPERFDNNSLFATLLMNEENGELRYRKDDVLYMEPRKDERRHREEFARCRNLTEGKYLCINSFDGFSENDRQELLAWIGERLDIVL